MIISLSPENYILKTIQISSTVCDSKSCTSCTSPLEKLIRSAMVVSALGTDLGGVLVAIQLPVSDAALLTVACSSAVGGQETHAIVLPRLGQGLGELVHHGLSVLRGGCDTQPLLATLNCWIVDGLNIHAILAQHLIRDGCTFCCIANLWINIKILLSTVYTICPICLGRISNYIKMVLGTFEVSLNYCKPKLLNC